MSKLIPIDQAIEKFQPTKQGKNLSTDEQRISESNVGAFIQDAHKDELNSLLLYCFSVSGLSPSSYPLEADKIVLIDFLLTSYPSFRLQEVRAAFQMNAAGRFGDVIEHFQMFSPTYLGKIMKAFRTKSQELKVYQQQAREWNKPVQPLTSRDELSDEYMVKSSYENYLKIRKWELIYPGCYKTLIKFGHGLSLEEGAAERKRFNSLSEQQKKSKGIPEDNETKFKKWLCAVVFNKFIEKGIKEFEL